MFSTFKPALFSAALLFAAANSAHALTFEDAGIFPSGQFAEIAQPLNNGDLADWTSFTTTGFGNPLWYITSDAYTSTYGQSLLFPSGSTALINLDYSQQVAFTLKNSGQNAQFVFNGLEAAAFTQNLGPLFSSGALTVEGFLNGQLVGTQTYMLGPTAFQWYDSGFANTPVDQLTFIATGVGRRWLIDNLDVIPVANLATTLPAAAVPEPETWAMLGLGLVALTARSAKLRRRARRQEV